MVMATVVAGVMVLIWVRADHGGCFGKGRTRGDKMVVVLVVAEVIVVGVVMVDLWLMWWW